MKLHGTGWLVAYYVNVTLYAWLTSFYSIELSICMVTIHVKFTMHHLARCREIIRPEAFFSPLNWYFKNVTWYCNENPSISKSFNIVLCNHTGFFFAPFISIRGYLLPAWSFNNSLKSKLFYIVTDLNRLSHSDIPQRRGQYSHCFKIGVHKWMSDSINYSFNSNLGIFSSPPFVFLPSALCLNA